MQTGMESRGVGAEPELDVTGEVLDSERLASLTAALVEVGRGVISVDGVEECSAALVVESAARMTGGAVWLLLEPGASADDWRASAWRPRTVEPPPLLPTDPRFDAAWRLLRDERGVGTPARMQDGTALVPLVLGGLRGVLVAPGPPPGLDLDALDTLQRLELLAVHASLCVAHVLAVRRDGELIARLRRSQVDLQRSQQRLVRSERMRALGDMAAGVAHDFNNVFNAILHRTGLLHGTVGVIREGVRDEALQSIERAALRGAETVRRLQDFTRQRHDRYDFAPVPLRLVVEEAIARAALEQYEVQLHVADVPDVLGEHVELVEVVSNLIANAIEASPAGGGLTLSIGPLQGGVLVEVCDAGVGMDDITLEHAFDPFFTTKSVRVGAMLPTGLGLSVAYGIVRRHGGELSLESRQGQGTTARMWLPAAAAPALAEERPLEPERPAAAAAAAGAMSLAGVRILLVEDDEINREATRALLQHAGLEVTDAASGQEAIDLFAHRDFDLVLSDLGMPDHDGWSVAAAVKSRRPTTPVALITGWGDAISDDERRARGVDVIVRKPVEPRRLLDHLTQLLDGI